MGIAIAVTENETTKEEFSVNPGKYPVYRKRQTTKVPVSFSVMAAAADDTSDQALVNMANVLYWSGWGLQPLPQEFTINALMCPLGAPARKTTLNCFIVCFCERYSEQELQQLRVETGTPGIQQDDYIGHNYLSVHWTEYNNIERVCNTVLRTRFLQIACKGMVFYPAGATFSWDTFEQHLIESITMFGGEGRVYPDHTERCKRPWIWVTERGRQLSDSLRRPFLDSDITDRENFWRWDCFQNNPCMFYAPGRTHEEALRAASVAPAAPIVPALPPKDTASMQVDQITCVVCLERPADTLVIPCEHIVVCHLCSKDLETSSNALICVICRSPIQKIWMDELP